METQYLLQLMLSKGICDAAIKKILHYAFAHQDVSLEFFCKEPIQLNMVFNCREDTLHSIPQNGERAKKLCDEMLKNGISAIVETESGYPEHLKKTLNGQCPPVLFVKGNTALLSTKSVGFCGSRKVSPKGVIITEQCVEQLASRGVTVVSGYAAGTDLAAHRAAIAHGGNTVFVLAEGLLKSTKKAEIRDMLTEKNHAFVSQFLPEQTWNVGNAMRRNAVIIGLSSAMILVESGKTGGTFAAGEESLKRGTPLFVIDYEKPEVSAEANPYFIEKGGMPIRGKKGIPNLEKVFLSIDDPVQTTPCTEQLMLDLCNVSFSNKA